MKFKKILKTIMASFMILGGGCALTSCNVNKSNKFNDTYDGPTYGIDFYRVRLNLGLKVGDLICPYTFHITRSSAYTNPVDSHYIIHIENEIRDKMGIKITGTKLYNESNDNILFDNKIIVDEIGGYVDCEFLPKMFACEVDGFFSKTLSGIWKINDNDEIDENAIYEYNISKKTGNGTLVDDLFSKIYDSEKNTSLNFENTNAVLNSDGTLTGYISETEQYTTTATFDNVYFEKDFYSKINNKMIFYWGDEWPYDTEFTLVDVKKQSLNGLFTIKTEQIDGKIYTYEFLNNAHTTLRITIENTSENTSETYKLEHY